MINIIKFLVEILNIELLFLGHKNIYSCHPMKNSILESLCILPIKKISLYVSILDLL